MNKDLRPGYWTASTSGHVDIGESYEQAAKRELKEELGITSKLEFVGKCKGDLKEEREIYTIFTTNYNGEIKFDKEEIDEIEFKDLSANLAQGDK